MRRFITVSFGLLSAVAGLLLIKRDDHEALRPAQIVVNETSWFPALLGAIAMLWALAGKPRIWLGLLAGGIGTALSLKPFMEYWATLDDAETAMRVGLGKHYEARIPVDVKKRLLTAPLTLPNIFGEYIRDARARVWRDVVYATPKGVPLKLDIYEPMTKPVGGDMYPAIIVIHGGGWQNGDKGQYFEPSNRYLANLGFVVFDIQYRLSGKFKWPAQLEDAQTALQWVRDHASEYKVDPKQIALLGRSAGAHIALMTGLRTDATNPVQAIIAFYAPADLKFAGLTPASQIYNLIGGSLEDLPEVYHDATPLDWVRDNLPPIFFVEGMQDTIVPAHHGDKLSKKLLMTNTPYVQIRLPWARHGFDAVTFGLGAQLVQYHLDRFLACTFFSE
ncbi:MAG: alpha/beta hydrolase fold domain-containing protein [Anaerolineaceae bacterium]|nr:alpha/beta hydrolase fold domain-containing protein [Anaerolineaceae bacterium]